MLSGLWTAPAGDNVLYSLIISTGNIGLRELHSPERFGIVLAAGFFVTGHSILHTRAVLFHCGLNSIDILLSILNTDCLECS